MKPKLNFLIIISIFLSSCAKDKDFNNAPIASFTYKDEISNFSLTSTATDADNDILSYKWLTDSDLISINKTNEKTAYISLPELEKSCEVNIKHIVFDHENSDTITQVVEIPALTQIREWGLGRQLNKKRSNNKSYDWYWDQSTTGQYSSDNCGPTCVTMAIKWAKPDFDKTPEYARSIYRSSGGWWYTDDIISYLQRYGVNRATIKLTNTDLLVDEIDKGRIIILCCDMYYVEKSIKSDWRVHKFYPTPNPDWGHFIIVKGYKKVDNELWFEVYDPYSSNNRYSDNTLKGKDRYYSSSSIDEATNIWWDYAILVSKEKISETNSVNTKLIEHKYGF